MAIHAISAGRVKMREAQLAGRGGGFAHPIFVLPAHDPEAAIRRERLKTFELPSGS